ncbi:MAG: phosphoribosylformylglycinamidine cyclo-ligase [Elusimicrobia bacterium RIFOXYA2_FULL_50_26]|nr:MAG: phosphoribosylformylglycinamidine cyclo-ligase [Elusimicrobia bacterium RIFOXYA2_FULL_50_26]OGS25274.1 MAG: phosphoribosylformylglycinamidine cyclo-ligase [Elusimicrobia bacterium RIFOXYB2_FULL_50_12]
MAITYKQAGVNIDAGNELVKRIKKMAPGIGGFSGLFPLAGTKYSLASSTDGVGTKLKIAFLLNKHDTIGIDLVAMNVNDLVCCGARPLFFLDYFATGKLQVGVAEKVIKGIVNGCKQADSILLGGETAEMPGFYASGEYDLAGFAVGVVEKGSEISGRAIRHGDVLIGIPSTGPHSNGYSLIRKVFSEKELKKYGRALLAPTKIYVKEILSLFNKLGNRKKDISAIAHITGGGFYDNIERLLPADCRVVVKKDSWKVPEIFGIIGRKGNVPEKEMYRTLNMGIGMILIVRPAIAARVASLLKGARVIGAVQKGKKGVDVV